MAMLADYFSRFLTRRWAILVLVAVAVETVLILRVISMPVSSSEAESAWEQAQKLVSGIKGQPYPVLVLSIFANNLKAVVLFIIPGLGWLSLPLSFISTFSLLAGAAAYKGIPWETVAQTFFIPPHVWLENAAYAIAIVQSFLLVYYAMTGRFRKELWRTGVAFVLSVTTLLAAALLEALEIAVGNHGGVIAAWVALAVLVLPACFLLRRSLVRNSARTEGAVGA